MLDKHLIKKKIVLIDQYLKELQPLAKLTLKQFLDDYKIYRTTERNLQLIVDTAIDINNHLIISSQLPPAEDYYQSFIQLGELKIFPAEFAKKIARSAGLRNRLVHAYENIDLVRIFRDLKFDLRDYQKYNRYILKYIDKKNR